MKKEIAEKWIAALKSGKYQQTIGYLCMNEEFTQDISGSSPATYKPCHCCLGVLCEIAIEEGLEITKHSSFKLFNGTDSLSFSYDNEKWVLPDAVQAWSGMLSNDGAGILDEQEDDEDNIYVVSSRSLAELNDAGRTFEEIADAIAKNWEKL